jgi:divalent metal cation (Fe/Co/Zn/Cd) transporter
VAAYSNFASVLAKDHLNDVMFNTAGITFGLIANYTFWYIDPVAAILIAGLIFRSWFSTGRENIQMLVGITVEPAVLSHLIYVAMTHDSRILQVDTCRAYHSGSNYFVEIDIVLPPDMKLWEAHDIGEALQIEIESLPNVDRAFVHLDYETDHKPEHKKSI